MARSLPIIQNLLLTQDVYVYVCCGEGQISFAKDNLGKELSTRITYRVMNTDVGLILQDGSLYVDKEMLERETSRYLKELPENSKTESEWLIMESINCVFCDMPIWAIEAAKLANVPLVYVGNFTWTEIYQDYLPEQIWKAYAKEYAKIEHTLLYALHNEEMRQLVNGPEVSVVARPFNRRRAEEIRKTHNQPVIFVSLGMSASFNEVIDVESVPYDFITTMGVPLKGKNVITLDYSVADTQNYILASDYVITKAGWGTVAECLLARKPMALFARDSVLEDRTTISHLQKDNLAVSIQPADLKNVEQIVDSMNQLDVTHAEKYYDSKEEITDYIMQICK